MPRRTETQVKREAARLAAGLCCWCGQPRGASKRYCDMHLMFNRTRCRRRKNCDEKQPGGRGREPMEVAG